MVLLELTEDQNRVIEALSISTILSPTDYIVSPDTGITGQPYKKIMASANLSLEKTLLSLGGLEAKGLVEHTCGIQRETIDYLGRSNVEIAGQKVVRIFSLTSKGLDIIKDL